MYTKLRVRKIIYSKLYIKINHKCTESDSCFIILSAMTRNCTPAQNTQGKGKEPNVSLMGSFFFFLLSYVDQIQYLFLQPNSRRKQVSRCLCVGERLSSTLYLQFAELVIFKELLFTKCVCLPDMQWF